MTKALIVVDVQRDFCEGGSLAVVGGNEAARKIKEYITDIDEADAADEDSTGLYDLVVATMDYHEDPGTHFAETPDYNQSWPVHCKIGTEGAKLHEDIDDLMFDETFLKGQHAAAYSGFEGTGEQTGERLDSFLHFHGVEEVDVVGIATDYCVKATALDAAKAGFKTRVLTNMVAGVAPETTEAAIAEMTAAGIEFA